MKRAAKTSHDTGPTLFDLLISPTAGQGDGTSSNTSGASSQARLVSTSVRPAKELALLVLEAAFGLRRYASSANSAHISWSWRTSLLVRATGSRRSAPAWNDSATRRYRSRLRQLISERHTNDPASSSWPTLTTRNNLLSASMQKWPANRQMWATLTATSYGNNRGGGQGRTGKARHSTEALARMQGGRLSSNWCHRFMGYPDEWCQLSVTPSSRSKRKSPVK
jgi:hypothetical protein